MPKNRLEAFSDGIIAFAITLLILEIHIPDLGTRVDNPAMLKAIVGLLPNFAVYVISFVVCTVWWVSHHTFIHDLHSVNRTLLWVNSLFLMLIAFMPFPTGLLGHHPGQPIATAFYGLVCTVTGFTFWLMRWYASTRANLVKPDFPSAVIVRRVRISLLGPLLYFTGTVLSLFYPIVALCLYAAIPSYFAFQNLGHIGSKDSASSASMRETDA